MKTTTTYSAALVLAMVLAFAKPADAQMVLWQKCLGGTASDVGECIVASADGGYYVLGVTTSTDNDVTENFGYVDYWVAKLDADREVVWQKTIGGDGLEGVDSGGSTNPAHSNIILTNDGGCLFTGWSGSSTGFDNTNHGGSDYVSVKFTSDGVIEWKKLYGGSQFDKGFCVRQTSEGGYVFGGDGRGYFNPNDGDMTGNHGWSDAWLVKTDDAGTIEWQKCYGGSQDEFINSVRQTSDGGYILAGLTNSTDGDATGNHGYHDGILIKVDADGILEWSKCFGGTLFDYLTDVIQTADGGYLTIGIAGSSDGDIPDTNGSGDGWFIKTDSEGTIEWTETYGGTWVDVFQAVVAVDDGYVATGDVLSTDMDVVYSHGASECWVVKVDLLGQLLWQYCAGGSSNDFPHSIQLTDDNNFIICGHTESTDGDVVGQMSTLGIYDIWIAKLNGNGPSSAVREFDTATSMYFNSAQKTLNIILNEKVSNAELLVYSIDGRIIASSNMNQLNNGVMNCSELKAGIYIAEILSDGISMMTHRFEVTTNSK